MAKVLQFILDLDKTGSFDAHALLFARKKIQLKREAQSLDSSKPTITKQQQPRIAKDII